MHIAVLLRDRCQPKKCGRECHSFCPVARQGVKVIEFDADGKPVISEELCVGCGICVHKCPFDAIKIIGLPEELREDLVHQYGENGFRLYRLPAVKSGKVIGLLGANGVGKTTAISVLSGIVIPNLGDYGHPPSWDRVVERYAGTVHGEYFSRLRDGEMRAALKPQYVDRIPRLFKGRVRDLLRKADEGGRLDEVTAIMGLDRVLDRDVGNLSGGELQKVAIAATLLKDADVYFFDEPSSYLDIKERLRISTVIKDLSERKNVYVVEHDLAILDFLADEVHILYGSEGAYGIVSQPKSVRHAINSFLEGYLREENIRFRDWKIEFTEHPPRAEVDRVPLVSWAYLEKRYEHFALSVHPGTIHVGEVVGVVGENATGKTTFVKMLAGVVEPTKGAVDVSVKVSYKPQYIKPDFEGTVEELLITALRETYVEDNFFRVEVFHPLSLKPLLNKEVQDLSGGELQRVAVALCLGREADIYLLDEPSAYLDANQRMVTARVIRRVMEKRGKSALVVDHDVYFIDIISDSIMVFSGEPGVRGEACGPFEMREGMNEFLRTMDITFRRDGETKRPRINKPGSYTDREQKRRGEYYYA